MSDVESQMNREQSNLSAPIASAGADPLLAGEILESISDAVIALDRQLRVVYLNRQALDYVSRLGLSAAQVLGTAPWVSMPDLLPPGAQAELRRMSETYATAEWEHRVERLQLWLECRASPSPSGVTLVARDITAHRSAERDQEHTAERLHLALEGAHLGDWSWDAATDEVRLSARAAAIFDVPPSTPITWARLRDRLYPEDRERARAAVERAVRERTDYDIHYRLEHPGDGVRWISAKGRGIYDDQGAIRGMLGVVQDITGEKEAEAQLVRAQSEAEAARQAAEERAAEILAQREEYETLCDELSAANVELTRREQALREATTAFSASEERYHSLVAATSSLVWVADPMGAFTIPQPSWEAFTGQTWDEYRGFGWSEAIHPEDRERVRAEWTDSVSRGEPSRSEGRLWHAASRSYRFFVARGVPIRDAAGTIYEWVGTVTDVDEQKRAILALHESERRFRQLAETIREVFWLSSPDKNELLYVSPAYEEVWGRSCQSLYQSPTSFVEAIHPEDRERVVAGMRHQNQGEATDNTYRIVRPDGATRWIRDRSFPMYDEAGRLFRVAGIAEDITEQKAAEDARRESEALSRQVFENSLDCIKVLDLDGRILSISAGGLRVLECKSPNELIGRRWPEVWQEDQALAEQAVAAARDGGVGTLVGFCPTLTGAPKWWDVVVSPIRDQEGRPERLLAISRDITQTRRHEAELREQSRTLDAVNRAAQVLAGELDLQKLLQALTDAATEVCDAQFGSFFYNLVGDDGEAYMLYTLSGVPKEAFSGFPMPRNTAIFAPTFRGEGILRLDDVTQDPRYGKSAPYYGMPEGHLPVRSYLAVPVTSRSGEVLGALFFGHAEPGIFSERHERILAGIAAQAAIAVDNARLYKQAKDAEYAARRHADELTEANRRKDEFISMLSHELRNPLGAISNAVAVLNQAGPPQEWTARLVSIVERQSRNLKRMVDDLLDASRLIHGLIELKPERVELRAVLNRAIDSCRGVIEARGHRFSLSVGLQPVTLEADPTRLEQILCNLLDNASKYTEPGGTLSLQAEYDADGEQPWVTIRVRDSGIGISAELLPHIFDLFTQAERTLDRAQGGLGIGLTVVLRLVQLHGGTIEAFSDGIGQGSEFVVRLPALAPEQSASGAQKPTFAPMLRPLRILVVDDLVDAAETLEELLHGWGQEVRIAHTGPTALRIAREFRPEVVLLDLGLPGWDGFEVARRLRELPGDDDVHLIAITGYGQDEDLRRTREAGFAAHLTKPVDLPELQRQLGKISAAAEICRVPHSP